MWPRRHLVERFVHPLPRRPHQVVQQGVDEMKFTSHIKNCARQTHTLARTLSMLLVCAAATNSSAAPVKALTWGSVDKACTQQTQMIPVYYPQTGAWDTQTGARAAAKTKNQQVGQRVLLLLDFVDDITAHPSDRCIATNANGVSTITPYQSPFLTNGIKRSQARIEKFFDEFKAAGGVVDYVIFDNEDILAAWKVGMDGLQAIENDSRFKSTYGKTIGFKVSQIRWGNVFHATWDALMIGIVDAAMNTAAYVPIKKRFPNARVTNYESCVLKKANASPDSLGRPMWNQSSGFGTDDAPSYYGGAARTMATAKFDGVNTIGSKPEDLFRFQLNRMRSVIKSSNGTRSQMPWISHRQFGNLENYFQDKELPYPMSSTKYWDEMVIQQVMHGADTLQVFNPVAWQVGSDPKMFNPKEDQFALESIITDLNQRLGSNPGKSRWFSVTGWADKVFITGRMLSNGTLWRISFTDDVNSIALPLRDGTIQIVTREEGTAGAWFFESYTNQVTVRQDKSEVAFIVVDDSVIQADLNNDSQINSVDMQLLVAAMGSTGDQAADLNNDGVVNQADQSQMTLVQTTLVAQAKKTIRGTTPIVQSNTQVAMK